MKDLKSLKVYQKAFHNAMLIFELSKLFPPEEKYSLTDQIRRSSRAVCANLAEAYRKRDYPKHFVSKLTDCDMENSDTAVWLDFALSCQYISKNQYVEVSKLIEEVGRMLNHMIRYPERYIGKGIVGN